MRNNRNNAIIFSIIALFVLAVVGATIILLMQNGERQTPENKSNRAELEESTDNGNRAEVSNANPTEDKQTTAGMGDSAGIYTEYDSQLVSSEVYRNRIIFFKADWCPTCSLLDRDIKQNLAEIPQGTIIMKADFDSSTELRDKYSVATQHTLVQVDSNGAEINKWVGSFNLADVLEQAELT